MTGGRDEAPSSSAKGARITYPPGARRSRGERSTVERGVGDELDAKAVDRLDRHQSVEVHAPRDEIRVTLHARLRGLEVVGGDEEIDVVLEDAARDRAIVVAAVGDEAAHGGAA